MSVTRFKVGDKVRVHSELATGHMYDDVGVNRSMIRLAGEIFTVKNVGEGFYRVHENGWGWNDEMLEPVEKTLDSLCRGDTICNGDNDTRKILVVIDGCYLLNHPHLSYAAGTWCTAAELDKLGYYPVDPDAPRVTIEINGNNYDKAEVEKAIKDLEPIK